TVVGNAVFAAAPLVGGIQKGNFAATFADADRYLMRPFASPDSLDAAPRFLLTSADAGAQNPAQLADWDRDFNGQPRPPGCIGAYAAVGANPGWRPVFPSIED